MLALIFSLWIGARPAELETLADRMRGLPPEFAADLLLRLAESPLIQERAWKRELIEDAFVFAAHAQWPYRRFGVRHTDSRPAREAWDNGLDSMALRTRAISDVLPLDRARARAMFQEIGRLALPRAGCEDALVPRLSIYYETARKLLEESFAPGERKEEEDVRFLERILAAVESPAQVEAAARLLAAAQLAPAQREALAAVFAAAIGRIDGPDRIFEANDWFVVETVAAAGGANGTAVLVPALRSYLVRHLTAPRCANRVDVGDRRQPAREFNALVQKLNGAGADFKLITDDEMKPLRVEPGYEAVQYWQSARSKQVLEALRWLNHGNRDLPDDKRYWTLAERSGNEWNAHYTDTLKLIEGWSENEEPSAGDYYSMKAGTYNELARLVPPGPARDNAMRAWLNFLEHYYGVLENRNLWFSDVSMMLGSVRALKDETDRAWLLDEMARSANPVISLYAQMEKLAPRGR